MHVPGSRLGKYRTRWTFDWLSPHEFSGGFNKIKEKKNEEIAQNHIAVFSTRFYHILTCIYVPFFSWWSPHSKISNTGIFS